MNEYNYKIENRELKYKLRAVKKELADYQNRYKQLVGSKRELRVENKFIKEEYDRLYADYMDVIVLYESLVDRFEDLSQSLINNEQKQLIRSELDFLKKRKALVFTNVYEDNKGRENS